MTPNVITIVVSASACGSGSLNVERAALPDDRRVAAAARRDQQHVGAVAQQREPDDDAAELALQHQVGADREERGGGGGEQRSSWPAPPRRLVAEGLEHHEHHADDDEVHADVEDERRADRRPLPSSGRCSEASRRRRAPRSPTGAAARRDRGDEQAGTEDRPRPEPRQARTSAMPAGDVAQGDRRAGHQPADEAAARLVVAGEQQAERERPATAWKTSWAETSTNTSRCAGPASPGGRRARPAAGAARSAGRPGRGRPRRSRRRRAR